MTTQCRACNAVRARAARENPNSFNHGVQCDACRGADLGARLGHMRAMWRDLRDQLARVDRSTRSGQSLAKDLDARMARLVAGGNALKVR